MTDASHEPHPDDLLASGHLDDDLSPSDRARVDADPALLARVDSFRRHQQALRSAPVTDDTAHQRDTAIAAALAEFDRLQHAAQHAPATATTTTGTGTLLRWRPRTTQRVLALAAGVAAIGIIGISAIASRGNESVDTSGASSADAKIAAADEVATDRTAAPADASAETIAGAIAADTGVTPTIGAIDAPATAAVTIDSPADLFAIAEEQGVLVRTGDAQHPEWATADGSLGGPACLDADEHYVTDVIYQGGLDVGVVTDGGSARILDATCTVLAEAMP